MMRIAGICLSVGLVTTTLAGCASTPANYAATLSKQDPKWFSPQCQQIRAEAANYKERKMSWAAGSLIGPYGLAIVAAGKDHQARQRALLAREIHLRCSSQPLPKKLQIDPATQKVGPAGR
jgi:hypothetical protein